MLFVLILLQLMVVLVTGEGYKGNKPYIVVPVPLDLPNRNEKAEQCWLRIEDVDVIETIAVSCHMAQLFLNNFIPDYNSRKIIEDKADVTPWNEQPYRVHKPISKDKNEHGMTSWKMVTVLDPTTHHRLYVTKNADCKVVMYSREGMTSYKVKCDNILYFINNNGSTTSLGCIRGLKSLVIIVYLLINITF